MAMRATHSTIEAMVTAEHLELCAFARGLSTDEWQVETLCDRWSARDVVIHLADHLHRTTGDALRAMVRGRLSPTRSAQLTVERHRDGQLADLLRWLELPVRSPSSVQLAELVIHQQDLRRPLGLARDIPEDRLIACLDFVLTRKGSIAVSGARRRAAGLRLSATDLAWSRGDGPEVRGPAEAILMAVNGRSQATNELHGGGTALLMERTQAPK
jgi:uncharacterized protein (TIGR03083 family)